MTKTQRKYYSYIYDLASKIKRKDWKAFANRVHKKGHISTVTADDIPTEVVDKALVEANRKQKKTKSSQTKKSKKTVLYGTQTIKETWKFHKQKIMSFLFLTITYFLYTKYQTKDEDKPNKPNKPRINRIMNKAKNVQEENANKIFECYHSGYKPPVWSRDNILELIDPKTNVVKCYYPSSSTLTIVKQVLTQREPVNMYDVNMYDGIVMQEFDKKLLKRYFGYTTGYYNLRLPYSLKPNIAVYNTSPVKHLTSSSNNDWQEVDKMHFLHCIGYAFDHEGQTDYQEIIKNKQAYMTKRLLQLYKNIFNIIFTCAKQYQLTTIALGLVGAGFFSRLYNSESPSNYTFKKNVFEPALQEVVQKHEWDIHNIQVLGNNMITINGDELQNIGRFPSPAMNKITPHNTLVVNAWDPLSIVGNGNQGDFSLDGYIGRHTACGLLCFPPTNPYIRYHAIRPFE